MRLGVMGSAFIGKVAATIFVAACTLLGFGPTEWVMFVTGPEIAPWVARGCFLALALVATSALLYGWLRDRGQLRVMIIGMVIIWAAMTGILGVLLWQQWKAPAGASVAPAQAIASTATPPPAWNENAILTLAFDADMNHASPLKQEGVRWYYWTHLPGLNVDFDNRKTNSIPGQVYVFLSLYDPTHTNYDRVRVIGGGAPISVLAAHPAGAAVRAIGDLRGRTIEIRFSKNPILGD